MRRGGRAASRWCPPTRWSWSKPRPRAAPRMAGRVEARQPPRPAAGRAGAAPGHGGAGRRLQRRRAVRRSARAPGLSRPDARASSTGRWPSSSAAARAWRPIPNTTASRSSSGVYRVPDRGIARRHRLGDRHHRQRLVDAGQVPARRGARHDRGELHRAAAHGRLLRLRRPRAGIRARARHDGLRAALGHKRKGSVRDLDGGRCRCPARWPTPCCEVLADAAAGPTSTSPSCEAAQPMLRDAGAAVAAAAPQARCWSSSYRSREGHHLYLYPFAGRNVHLGLAQPARVAAGTRHAQHLQPQRQRLRLRAARAPSRSTWRRARRPQPVRPSDDLLHDVLASLNSSALAQRRFREIARVAGPDLHRLSRASPRARASCRRPAACSSRCSASTTRATCCCRQAEHEVLSQELEIGRLGRALRRMRAQHARLRCSCRRPSPFSLPLMVERLAREAQHREAADRLDRMLRDMECAADRAESPPLPALRGHGRGDASADARRDPVDQNRTDEA